MIREAARFNVVDCGRRWGKTQLGIIRLSAPALEGKPAAWFAPEYKYLDDAWRDFNRCLKPAIRSSNATSRRIELVTGGSIEFWTLDDPDAGRSRKYAAAAIDEAAKVARLEQAWNESIRPTLIDFKGWADFYSTPKGHNFFWKAWVWGQEERDGDWRSWKFATSSNPHIDPAEIEAARNQLPERVFQQELLAEFLEDAGGVFRLVGAAIDRGRSGPDPPRPGVRAYSTGIDLARSEDFTVLSTLDPEGKQVHFERFTQVGWERQIETITAVMARYPGTAVVDATGLGNPIFEALRARRLNVLPFTFTNASKLELIDGLALALERGHLRLMDVPAQEAELLAFEYQMTAGSRTIRMGAPEGLHDDTVIALALARHAQGQPRMPLLMRL